MALLPVSTYYIPITASNTVVMQGVSRAKTLHHLRRNQKYIAPARDRAHRLLSSFQKSNCGWVSDEHVVVLWTKFEVHLGVYHMVLYLVNSRSTQIARCNVVAGNVAIILIPLEIVILLTYLSQEAQSSSTCGFLHQHIHNYQLKRSITAWAERHENSTKRASTIIDL